MRIFVMLFVIAEALQWLLIIYLFAKNARLKRERDAWRFTNDPPRSVVDTESDFEQPSLFTTANQTVASPAATKDAAHRYGN